MTNDRSSLDVDSNFLDILDDNIDEASPSNKEIALVLDVRRYFFYVIGSDVERKLVMRWGGITFKATALSLLVIDEQAWEKHARAVLLQRAFIYGALLYLLARLIFLYITPSQIRCKQDGIFIQGFGIGSKYSGRDSQGSLSGGFMVFFGIRPKRQLEATQDKHAIYYEVEYKKHWYHVHSVEDANLLAAYEVLLVQSNSAQKEFVGESLQLEQERFIAQEITLFYGLGEYGYDDKTRVQYFRLHG